MHRSRKMSEIQNELHPETMPEMVTFANLSRPSLKSGIPPELIDIETAVRGQGVRQPVAGKQPSLERTLLRPAMMPLRR